MPLLQEAPTVESLEFNWGKKRGVGGKRKEVQFYESFTFDGEEYSLYDCVYLYHEREPEPYIGKIIKIWEQPGPIRKIKVLWFFRLIEVKNWLGDREILENEIFLASGEGVGLANINPLEAIAGKCNVVCTSKDSRNPQPSEEEMKMADYVFCRTFDVGTCSISDKICDKIGGIEVKNIFNRSSQSTSYNPKLDALQKEENGKVIANSEVSALLTESCLRGSLEDVMTNDNPDHAVRTRNKDLKTALMTQEPLPGGNLVCNTRAEPKETEATAATKDFAPVDGTTLPRQVAVSVKDEDKTGEVLEHKVEDEGKLKSVKDDAQSEDRPLKKAKLDTSVLSEKQKPCTSPTLPIGKDKNEGSIPKKLGVGSDEVDVQATEMNGCASEEKTKSGVIKDTLGKDKGSFKLAKCTEKTAKLSDESGVPKKLGVGSEEVDVQATEMNGSVSDEKTKSRPMDSLGKDKGSLKVAKCPEKTAKLSNESSVPKKLGVGSDEVDVQATEMNGSASEEKTKSRLIKDSVRKDKGSFKLAKSTEKTAKLSNGTLLKTAAAPVPEKNNVTDGRILEVTTRPNADRSKWFKGFPWEERMKTAYDQGTLVLLENLDPTYTSSEIEDIIWHGFGETCTARGIPRTATSSQHSGQAFVVFKSRDAAELAIRKLDEGCLLLPNGRPLIASKGVPPSVPAKQTFAGHIFIDQIKMQMQREEMRKAVSTSHCSQPNTIEYEMAMEWCLLQARADSWWKDLYKQHGDEVRKLRANLRFR